MTYSKSFVRAVDSFLDFLEALEYLDSPDALEVFFERSVRVISIARLNTSLCVHLQPINVVVCNYPVRNSNLVASFALRCFQRLSVPDLVTRRCPGQDSRCARGQSDTVLSRATLIGEQPNPWDLLQPQDVTSRHRGAKPLRRSELLGGISLLSPEYLLSFERWPFHAEPPDHYAQVSFLCDLSVSQSSALMPLHSAAGCQSA